MAYWGSKRHFLNIGIIFFLKTGYTKLRDKGEEKKIYNRIWSLQVSPKVRTFIWLCFRKKILTIDNLQKRGFNMANRCYLCENNLETIDHIFIHCSFARDIWQEVLGTFGVQWVFHEKVDQMVEEWFFTPFRAKELGKIWDGVLAQVLWGIWKERNRRIFEGKKRECGRIWNFAAMAVKEGIGKGKEKDFQGGTGEEELSREWGVEVERGGVDPRKGVIWVPPGEGWVKLNFDGAAKGNPGEAGGGGVLRNWKGEIEGAFEEYYGIATNHQAEIRAMRRGVLLLKERGYSKVVIEGDSLNVIKMLKGEQKPDWRTEPIINDSRKVIKDFVEVDIRHTYREGNRVADCLANRAVAEKQDRGWSESYPASIQDIARIEMPKR